LETKSRLKKHGSVAATTRRKKQQEETTHQAASASRHPVAIKTRRSKFGAFYDPIADTQDVFPRTFRSMNVGSEGSKEGADPFTRLFSFDDWLARRRQAGRHAARV
jgi:hypothetical protein